MRQIALLLLEIVGIAAVIAGISLVYVPAAVIVGGLAVIAVAEQRS